MGDNDHGDYFTYKSTSSENSGGNSSGCAPGCLTCPTIFAIFALGKLLSSNFPINGFVTFLIIVCIAVIIFQIFRN